MYSSTFLLTTALVGGEWSASRSCRFTPGERAPGTQWIGGWVDPRAGLDDLQKRKSLTLRGLELRPLGRPARSQSLYRLRYPGSRLKGTSGKCDWFQAARHVVQREGFTNGKAAFRPVLVFFSYLNTTMNCITRSACLAPCRRREDH
jgi:hypothetical protein